MTTEQLSISLSACPIDAPKPGPGEADTRPRMAVHEVANIEDVYRLLHEHQSPPYRFTRSWFLQQTAKTISKHKKTTRWYVGGLCDGFKTKENIKSRSLVNIDLDKPGAPSTIRALIKLIQGAQEENGLQCGFIVYRTAQYSEENPRYRVLVLLDKPVVDQRAYRKLAQAVAKKVGLGHLIGSDSWDWSLGMYAPRGFLPDPEDLIGEHDHGMTCVPGPNLAISAVPVEVDATVEQYIFDPDKALDDPIPEALARAGLDPQRRTDGGWDFTCPLIDQHEKNLGGTSNQTTYFPATEVAAPLVKCFDTAPDEHGPHLTFASLVAWLVKHKHLDRAPVVLPEGAFDTSLGKLVADFMAGGFLYIKQSRRWLHYSGDGVWSDCVKGEELQFVVRQITPWLTRIVRASTEGSARYKKAALLLAMASDVRDMPLVLERFTGSDPRIAAALADFDTDPAVLALQNGVLNLTTGELLPYSPDMRLRRRAAASWNPRAKCPRWLATLRYFQPDADMRAYLQLVAGYSLTSDVSAEMLFFHFGGGDNGKSTFLETLQAMLGDYANDMRAETVFALQQQADANRPTPELMKVVGRRMVVTGEVPNGRSFDEATVKSLASTTALNVRGLHEQAQVVKPTAKLHLQGNVKPKVKEASHGFWRRMVLVPWEVTITEDKKDPDFKTKLRDELDGVLQWAFAGLRRFHADPKALLDMPEPIKRAVRTYRSEEDEFGRWLALHTEPGDYTPQAAAYESYDQWARDEGIKFPLTKHKFTRELAARGFPEGQKRVPGKRLNVYRGLALVAPVASVLRARE